MPVSSTKSKKGQQRSFLNAANSYLDYYANSNSHTGRAKRLDIQHFTNFLSRLYAYSKPEKIKLKDWDFSSVQRFVDDCLSKGEAPATVARRLATLKHMGRTLSEKLPNFTNPAREVKTPTTKVTKPKSLSKKEISNLSKKDFKVSKKITFKSIRNHTLFSLLLDTGLRADEVRLLKMSQLDEELEWIQNVRTKGRKYRNVYITSHIRKSLKNYLEEREKKLKQIYGKLTIKENQALPVFISTYNAVPGERETFYMGAKSIWRAINELSQETHLHPHLLRHSYALDLLESSNDIRLVAQALGHSDVRVTMRYTERHEEEIARALEKSRKKA